MPATVTFGQIKGGYQPYVVPDECRLWMDFRTVCPDDANRIMGIVEKACEDTGIDTSKVALFSTPELEIVGMLKNCIRVMVTLYLEENSELHMVYMNGAEVLRPDFAGK